jgi:hypothetical protein
VIVSTTESHWPGAVVVVDEVEVVVDEVEVVDVDVVVVEVVVVGATVVDVVDVVVPANGSVIGALELLTAFSRLDFDAFVSPTAPHTTSTGATSTITNLRIPTSLPQEVPQTTDSSTLLTDLQRDRPRS